MPVTLTPSSVSFVLCTLKLVELIGVTHFTLRHCSSMALASVARKRTFSQGYRLRGALSGRLGHTYKRAAPKVSNSFSTCVFKPVRAAMTAVVLATPTIIPSAVKALRNLLAQIWRNAKRMLSK